MTWSNTGVTNLLWLAKKTQLTFILDNMVVPTMWIMAWMKNKCIYTWKIKQKSTVVEWNEGMNI